MKRTSPEMLDYYDEEVVRRIVEKHGYSEREALELFLSSKTYQWYNIDVLNMCMMEEIRTKRDEISTVARRPKTERFLGGLVHL